MRSAFCVPLSLQSAGESELPLLKEETIMGLKNFDDLQVRIIRSSVGTYIHHVFHRTPTPKLSYPDLALPCPTKVQPSVAPMLPVAILNHFLAVARRGGRDSREARAG